MNEPLANSKTSTGAGNGEREPARVDTGREGSGPRLGAEPEGLRPRAEGQAEARASARAQKAPRGERDEASYVIDVGLRILKMLECMEGRNFEPVTFKRAMQRSGFDRNFVRSAMITLKKAGWVKEVISGREREFILGPKAENLAKRLSASLLNS
jgi:hypothetical protein